MFQNNLIYNCKVTKFFSNSFQFNKKRCKTLSTIKAQSKCGLRLNGYIQYIIFCLTCNSHVIFSMGKVKIFLYSHSYDQLPASLARGCSWPPSTTGSMSASLSTSVMLPAISCAMLPSSNTSIEGYLYSFFIVQIILALPPPSPVGRGPFGNPLRSGSLPTGEGGG